MNEKQSLLNKIKNLLNRAEHENTNEHERNACMKKANQLMQEHSINEDQLSEQINPKGTIEIEIGHNNWKRRVFYYISIYYGSYVYYSKNKIVINGRQNQVITTKLISLYIINSIESEYKRIKHTLQEPNKNSFAVGAVQALGEKINQMIRQRETDALDTTGENSIGALAVIKNNKQLITEGRELAEKNVREQGNGGLRKGSKTTYRKNDSSAAGRQYGQKLNVNAHIGGARKARQAIN